ncbi:MAG: hypothetical protein EXQ85_00800 [Alphaproteobacteria bacterium]|nr:hypothetical protein [Alphaproteobacteria bacterium]
MEFWYALLVFVHALLFVYWLGGDLGVFYASRFRNNTTYDLKTRQVIGKITADIDMAPRTTLVLMLPIGFSVAAANGWSPVTGLWLVLLWIAGLLWLGLVWWLHIEKDAAKKQPWAKFDLRLRLVLMLVLAASALYSLATGAIYGTSWLALKVFIFSLCILCGYMIRVTARPYVEASQRLAKEGSSPEIEAILRSTSQRPRIWVKCIWGLVALAAFIGLWKPVF